MTHECFGESGRAYAQLRRGMVGFARRLVGPDAAEDVVQEVFLQVLRRGAAVPRDDEGVPLRPYLFAAIRNAAVDGLRRSRSSELPEGWDGADPRLGAGPDAGDPGARSEMRELAGPVRLAMPGLSRRQWEATVLTTVGGLSADQAATATGGSRSAITGSRERAVRYLRERVTAGVPERC